MTIASATAAAVLSHYVIDVVADYLVPHASFDDVASHGSRGWIAVIALVAAVAIALRGLRLCCDAVNGRGALALPPPSWWKAVPMVAIAAVSACILVPAMEVADGLACGVPVDGLADAYGGSIALGAGTSALCAVLVACAFFAIGRWLFSHRERFVAAIAWAIERTYLHQTSAHQLRRYAPPIVCQPRFAASRRGERAPPCNARIYVRSHFKHCGEIYASHAGCGVLPDYGPRPRAFRRSDR